MPMETQDKYVIWSRKLIDWIIKFLNWVKAPMDRYIWNNMSSDLAYHLRDIRDDINQEISRLQGEKQKVMVMFEAIDNDEAIKQ